MLTLTPPTVVGLFFIQRYRFLTVAQFARASGLSRHRAENLLHSLEPRGLLGYFGFVRIRGMGRRPRPTSWTRRGFELLRRESDAAT